MLGSDNLQLSKLRSSRRQSQTTPQPDPLKCPRCESTNTKFCYYNNYDKTQPRHFCKACKRHWTRGGILRNVPIGGVRKNKRFKQPNNTATTAIANVGPTVIRNNPYLDHNSVVPGLSDLKDIPVAAKASFFKPIDSERREDVESYTDIEELKGLVSWDLYGSFSGCTMQQLAQEDHQRLGFSKLSSSSETNPSLSIPRSFIEKIANLEDSTITTTSMIMSSSQQWHVASTHTFLESNYQSWNELDTMVLEDLNKPWEDLQFDM